jgi:hypothetical protein
VAWRLLETLGSYSTGKLSKCRQMTAFPWKEERGEKCFVPPASNLGETLAVGTSSLYRSSSSRRCWRASLSKARAASVVAGPSPSPSRRGGAGLAQLDRGARWRRLLSSARGACGGLLHMGEHVVRWRQRLATWTGQAGHGSSPGTALARRGGAAPADRRAWGATSSSDPSLEDGGACQDP